MWPFSKKKQLLPELEDFISEARRERKNRSKVILESKQKELLEKLVKYNVFDFDISEIYLEEMKSILDKAGLKYYEFDRSKCSAAHYTITLVVGYPEADFARHEKLR